MSSKNRFSKPVAFNKKNEKDQLIIKHVSRRNFSGYVKKLILEDMERKGKEVVSSEKEVDEVAVVDDKKEKTAAERIEELKKKAGIKPAN